MNEKNEIVNDESDQLDPTPDKTEFIIGHMAQSVDKNDKAEIHYKRALEFNPKNEIVHVSLASL